MSSEGKNVVAMEKIKTSVVTTTNEAFFNPAIKLNLLQIHQHHPTQQNILQCSPHDNMKMAAVHASMSTRGCDGKEILMSILLSPAGLTRPVKLLSLRRSRSLRREDLYGTCPTEHEGRPPAALRRPAVDSRR